MANAWRWWDAPAIARITGCPLPSVGKNWPLIYEALVSRGIADRDVQMGVLGTVAIETASTFEPIHEYGTPSDWAGYGGGALYAGRGFPQLTHLGNYRDAGAALAVDLVGHPDLALDPTISADILAWFWATKGVPSKDRSHFYSLVELCHEHDWEWVRRVFQGGTAGLDRLIAMASALDAYAPSKEPAVPTYNLDLPIVTQNHDWDCAEQATLWAVTAAGRHPDDAWMEQAMLQGGIESTELGLLVGDGSRLAVWITEQYSDGSPTLQARNASPVSFDEVRSVAGTAPVLLGGHHWGAAGHWTGVRRYDDQQGTLVLANPGGTGPVYGLQTLDRQQFAERGPWSMVIVMATGVVATPPSVPAPAPDPQAEIDHLRTLIGYMGHDIPDALEREVATIRQKMADASASLDALQAAIDTLKRQVA